MKQLVLGLCVIACGRSPGSPGSPGDASVDGHQNIDASTEMSGDAAWMDVADPPDSLATPCPGTLGFPSVPLVYGGSLNGRPIALDVDGDLVPDVVAVVGWSVMASRGRGDGTFEDPVASPIGAYPFDLAVVDVDGDMKPDIVVTTQSNTVVVLHNQGAMSFAAVGTLATAGDPSLIAYADLDGDHAQDLVVASNAGSATLGVYLNHGDGTFAAPVTYSAGGFTTGLAVEDVSGDGKPDVVITDIAGTVGVYANTGNGGLATPSMLATDPQPRWVAIANVAGDAKLDIVVSEQATDGHLELGVFTNLGGSFAARQDYQVGGNASPMRFALADLDGDGHLDALLNAGVTDTIDMLGVVPGTASGGFGTATPYWNVRSNAATTSDLNGDGKLDIVAGSQTANLQIMLNAGDGTFPAPRKLSVSYQPAQIAARDLDGDGMLDVVVAGNDSFAQVYFNDGHGGLVAPISGSGVARPAAILFGDVDGNGTQDVVIPDSVDPHKVAVWLGHGNRTFTSTVVPLPIDPQFSVLLDVNHDGVRDLVVADASQLMVLTYQSNGTFAVSSTTPTSSIASGIVAGDVNRDGSQDVVVSHQSGGATTFIGNGASGWQAQIDIPSAGAPLSIGDLDGNGTLDLVLGNGAVLGQGDGSFGAVIPGGFTAHAIHVRDVDGDGRLDLVGMYAGEVMVKRGNGDGTFRSVSYEFGTAPALAIVDLDMDGRPDLIGATYNAVGPNDLFVYPGRCLP